jgi:predicted TIM-barrel fold metal-dependent hydrolase
VTQSYSDKIDIFTHILPPQYGQSLYKHKKARDSVHYELQTQLAALSNLDDRFRMMDKYPGLKQVLTLAQPPLECVVGPKIAIKLAKLANDEMADLVAKYPDRFVAAAACLPMNDMDAALQEAARAMGTLGLKGVQIVTPVNGKPLDSPEFMCLYELMSKHDLPIWIHPGGERSVPDYVGEEQSKYDIYSRIRWPYETSLAMARLVYSGVFDKFPGIKFITHHGGAMTSFFASRLSRPPGDWLKKPPLEYFKMFYVDTALGGYVPSIMFSYNFFGADHMVFGTDMPFGGDAGFGRNIAAIESLQVEDSVKRKILADNVKRLIHLEV